MAHCTVSIWEAGDSDSHRTEPVCRGRRIDLEDVQPHVADPSTLVWIDLLAPTMREFSELGRQLGLHPLEIEDAIAPRERPKAARHDGRAMFVVYALTPRRDVAAAIEQDEQERRAEEAREAEAARDGDETPPPPTPENSAEQAEVATAVDEVLEGGQGAFGDALFLHTRISGFVFPHALVTVRSGAAFSMDLVEERWEDLGDVCAVGPYGLVHGLLDVVVDEYFDAVQFLDDRIEDLEDDLFTPEGRLEGFQKRAYALRKELVTLRRVVMPVREVITVLWRRRPGDRPGGAPGSLGSDDARRRADARLDALYADLMDHVLRVTEWTESLRDMVSTVFETHLSLQDQRLNEVTKRLAGWAAVISVPTLVTGWYGMNVPYPGHDQPAGLVVASLLVVVPSVTLWAVMRKINWL